MLALLFVLTTLSPAAQGAGEIDPTFDGDGLVVTDFGANDVAADIAIQADGKIVAAGDTGSNFNFALARYNPDGSLDKSFDGDGRVVTGFGRLAFAAGVAIQADGKIVAAGAFDAGSSFKFALTRYNPDGSLDKSFNGDGKVVNFSVNGVAWDLAIEADGKIVAAGYSTLARYNPDGSLDLSFGDNGNAAIDFSATAVAIQADGKIVAAGTDANFALARYNPDGSLDTSFDGDGKAVTDFGGRDEARDLAIQADGKIVAAGTSEVGTNPSVFALARYKPDGRPDTSFDGDGKAVTDLGGGDVARGIAIQADGKIVAAGYTGAGPSNFALARYNPDGSLDTSFDGDGRVVTDFGESSEGLGIAIQPDGKIVAAGYTYAGVNPPNFALARYLPGAANLPPDCSTVQFSRSMLWPPNRKLVPVNVSGATDPDGDRITITVTGVTQDEPTGRVPDAKLEPAGNQLALRAERSNHGDGRVYRIAFSASDGKGGACTGTATVGVPRRKNSPAVDSVPPSYNSLGA